MNMKQPGRIPPHNDEAERSVLGSILQDKDVFFEVSEFVREADFYSDAHKEIFDAMQELYGRSEPVDIITVGEALQRRKSLEAVGGRSYIASLSGSVPTTANAAQYAKIVADKAVLRRLISAASGIAEECFADSLDTRDVLDNAERNIFDIAKTRQSGEYEKLNAILNRNIAEIEEAQSSGGILPGLPTGYIDLDAKTTGLQKSDMVIIAARPSMGKTAFALNIAQNAAASKGARVVIFSLEMSAEDLGLRMLATEARKNSKKLRTGNLDEQDWMDINEALDKLAKSDIIIDDTPGIGVMEIRNKCRRINQEKPIDLIIIDYLQMMVAERVMENRQQEVTAISRYLKQLAREMECPVLVLSQLSRASEKRTGKHRPLLSDLRESGAIEQDADVVLFLYREDYYKNPDEKMDNLCEVIIAKQRKGETGSITLSWQPQYTRFVNYKKD